MEDYKFEVLEKVQSIVNRLDVDGIKGIMLDVDDSYDDETEITITIELHKRGPLPK